VVTFAAGALHDQPRRSDTERWSGSPLQHLWAAAEFLEAAWQSGAPADPRWANQLRTWAAAGGWAEPVATTWDAFVAEVEVVSEAVYGELRRRWDARSSVLKLWTSRLYQPVAGDTIAGVYDSDELWSDIEAVNGAMHATADIEFRWRDAMDSACLAAVRAAIERSAADVEASKKCVREAGAQALTAMKGRE